MIRHLKLLATTGLLGVLGCGAEPSHPADGEAVAATSRGLMLLGAKWPTGDIRICWSGQDRSIPLRNIDDATIALNRKMVQAAVERTWPQLVDLRFTFADCPTPAANGDVPGQVVTWFTIANAAQYGPPLGYHSFMNLQIGVNADVGGTLSPHEIGHALGFPHEMGAPGFFDTQPETGACTRANGDTGQTLGTPADRGSIMAGTYCHWSPELSFWDVVGAQAAYGRRAASGLAPLLTARSQSSGFYVTTVQNLVVSSPSAWTNRWGNGFLFDGQRPGTVALKRWLSAGRSVTTTGPQPTFPPIQTPTLIPTVLAGTEGYVYSAKTPGTVALKTYARTNGTRVTTADPAGQAQALLEGYRFDRLEGYVLDATNWRIWDGGAFDPVFYLSRWPDLRAAFGNDFKKADDHFAATGIDEGRTASPAFDPQFYLAVQADVASALGPTAFRAALSHWRTHGQTEGRAAAPAFDPRAYLALNPSLSRAIGVDHVRALDHWLRGGLAAGLPSSFAFDPSFYAAVNPDVAKFHGGGNFRSYLDHWLVDGVREKRMSSLAFEPAHYLARYPDVNARSGGDGMRALTTWYASGLAKGQAASSAFDPVYYLGQNPDLVAAFGATGYVAALVHWLTTGIDEGRAGSAEVSPAAYLARHADLRQAFGPTAYRRALVHYYTNGRAERRDARP